MHSSLSLVLACSQFSWILEVNPTRKDVITCFLLSIESTYVEYDHTVVLFVLVDLICRLKTDTHWWEGNRRWSKSEWRSFSYKSFFLTAVDNLLFYTVNLNIPQVLLLTFLFTFNFLPNVRYIDWLAMCSVFRLQEYPLKEFYLVGR